MTKWALNAGCQWGVSDEIIVSDKSKEVELSEDGSVGQDIHLLRHEFIFIL